MLYLSQMLNKPVLDSEGVEIGRVSDLAIQTGEVFPRITSVAFLGPSKTPFMVSWRKYVEAFDHEDGGKISITLKTRAVDIRFSYLQPDELLLNRDLLNKQIVDTQGLKVVRVNDLKLSSSGPNLRLLGAEVGLRGLLRNLSPLLERAVVGISKAFWRPLEENIIAWNYMELVDRDLSTVKLSMTHKRLAELHPADVADILEQLDPKQRGAVFEHLDKQQAAQTFSELEDVYQADMLDDLSEHEAAGLLAQMEPDDAADILGDLPYEKAEKLLWLMGVSDERRIRNLLGYKDKTAGGIMTPDFVAVPEGLSVGETIERIRGLDENHESVHYVYTLDSDGQLLGALSLRSLVLADNDTLVGTLAESDLITASPDDDQENVADVISKYDLLALPVVDETGKLLGIVTIDDAMDVLEEEHSEDLQIAGAANPGGEKNSQGLGGMLLWLLRKELWFVVWAVFGILAVMSGNLSTALIPLLFSPFVLLIADDIVAYAFNDLLEYGSAANAPKPHALLGRNFLASLVTAIVASGLAFVFFQAVSTNLAESPFAATLQNAAPLASLAGFGLSHLTHVLFAGALSSVLAAFLLILLGVTVTLIARHRLNRDKGLAVLPITLIAMVLGLALQIASYLVILATPLVAA